MKAICPGHGGPVDVHVRSTQLKSQVKLLVFACPVCEEEVMLSQENFDAYEKGMVKLQEDKLIKV